MPHGPGIAEPYDFVPDPFDLMGNFLESNVVFLNVHPQKVFEEVQHESHMYDVKLVDTVDPAVLLTSPQGTPGPLLSDTIPTTDTKVQKVPDNWIHDMDKGRHVKRTPPDFGQLRRYFLWSPAEIIKKAFECTTHTATASTDAPFRHHAKSRNPDHNVPRRLEPATTEYIYSDTPAVASGVTGYQLFIGRKTRVADVYPAKSTKSFSKTLLDNIRERGAMDQLISDSAPDEVSNKVKDILRSLLISKYQSSPGDQHQDYAENQWQYIKQQTNNAMNCTGAPAFAWLLAIMYVCYIMNRIAVEGSDFETPLFCLTGQRPDISMIFLFYFWQPVYYTARNMDKPFPSSTLEEKGRFVGLSENVGDVMTFKVLTASNKVVNTRYVRAAQSGELNWRVEAPKGEEIEYIKSTHELRMKRIYDYVRKNPKSAVRFRTHKPDFFNFEYKEYDWAYSVYGNVREQIPENLDDPLGESVIVWAYTDANLYHDYVTGRATTGIILFINGTPVEWMSKRQRVTETATYGSEFTAARICTDLTVSVRQELRYFGVPVEKVSYMFGDNKSVITSSTIPHSSLNKQHNALNYHCVREAVVSGFLWFIHVVSPENVSDVLSKHCGFQEFWPHIQPILFWKGDTMDCPQPKRTPKQKGPSLEELYFT